MPVLQVFVDERTFRALTMYANNRGDGRTVEDLASAAVEDSASRIREWVDCLPPNSPLRSESLFARQPVLR